MAVVHLGILGDRAIDGVDITVALADDLVLRGAEGGTKDLDFALGALDSDRGAGRVETVGVGGHLDRGGGNARHLVLGEVAHDARRLIGAGAVLVDGGEDIGRLLVLLEVIQCLEDPGEGVNAEIEERTAREIQVDHAVGVGILDGVVVLAIRKGKISCRCG